EGAHSILTVLDGLHERHRPEHARTSDLGAERILHLPDHGVRRREFDQRVEQAAVRPSRLVHVLEAEEFEGRILLHRESWKLGEVVVGRGIVAVLKELDAQDRTRALVVVDQSGRRPGAGEGEQQNGEKRSLHRGYLAAKGQEWNGRQRLWPAW